MALPKRYNPTTAEPELQAAWQTAGTTDFDPDATAEIFSIDTPPPTVSGKLHLGHVYSYSHADFVARFQRMRGKNVYYPMGFDDNGLPTERLVEQTLGITVHDLGREAFIERCLAVSAEAEKAYETLWRRLGLSIDWRYTYRTIDADARRIAQWSFVDLARKGLAYRQKAPAIWCPECRTAIAQAELDDLERETTFYTLDFGLPDGRVLPIATTRPELLPACVAVFVHPDDSRYTNLVGKSVSVPHFGQQVPLLADPAADPAKGTGAVMCCTFGDQTDVEWWRTHDLPLVEALTPDGRMTEAAGAFAGLPTAVARRDIVAALEQAGLLRAREPLAQSVRVHERCDTAVEYRVTPQWFVRVLDFKPQLLAMGDAIRWHPAHMHNRYTQWVENLSWDWCISRQRTFGVPFPAWTCAACGTLRLADAADLPIDPAVVQPATPCDCGSAQFIPEPDVMDTWATSSMSPQIAGRWGRDDRLAERVMPYAMRPQAHEIIRTWAFYTIVKALHHSGQRPWTDAVISGWGIAGPGMAKLSKSRGGGPMPPLEMIAQYSADAVRYWAASTGLGKDAAIDEARIQAGAKLVTKLWNVARFAGGFLETTPPAPRPEALTAADRWILARTQQVITRTTALFEQFDYAGAKADIETYFWRDLADNYLEMAKQRLYEGGAAAEGARFALHTAVLATIKLFAPLLPHVTERIYQGLFAASDGSASVHTAAWPEVDARWLDYDALVLGEVLLEIATAVRRHKSDQGLSLGAELAQLTLAVFDAGLMEGLTTAVDDLKSVARVTAVAIEPQAADGDARFTVQLE